MSILHRAKAGTPAKVRAHTRVASRAGVGRRTGYGAQRRISTKRFTVAIFGSARIKKDDPIYRRVYKLGRSIGAHGLDIVTGGGPGIMEAANRGHQDGRKDRRALSLGLNIILPKEQLPNKHLDIKKEFHLFSRRLDTFMQLADVVVVGSGGVGTLLELLYAWQLIQVREINDVPVILVGDMWKEFVDWVDKWPLRRKLLSASDMECLFLVRNNSDVMDIIEVAHLAHTRGEKYTWKGFRRKLSRACEPSERGICGKRVSRS